MTDRPIIFSAPMVRALLDGRKTQTRRVLRADLQQSPYLSSDYGYRFQARYEAGGLISSECTPGRPHPELMLPLARFAVGDRLWVRERLGLESDGGIGWPIYMADEAWVKNGIVRVDPTRLNDKPKASIHMPRWASRLTLAVTDVRVQRLQEIDETDAINEGALTVDLPAHGAPEKTGRPPLGPSPRQRFHALWSSLHGAEGWDANPWVAALTFTVERRNIDALARAA